MEKAMAPHSSTLAWKIPWAEEPGGLQSMGSLRVGHDWATSLFHFSLSCIGEGNGNPLQCSCLENPRDGRAQWAAVSGVAQSQTQLKQLSSSSSSSRYMKGCYAEKEDHLLLKSIDWFFNWLVFLLLPFSGSFNLFLSLLIFSNTQGSYFPTALSGTY